MAQITINIPNDQLSRVINAMAVQYGYEETIINQSGQVIANPQTKAEFAKAMVIKFAKAAVIAYEASLAVADYDQVKQAAVDKAESEITIT